MGLQEYGWDRLWERHVSPCRAEGLVPARVVAEELGRYRLVAEDGFLLGEVSGRFRHEAQGLEAFPVVGDWVAVRPRLEEGKATLHGILPRRGSLSRKATGPDDLVEQVMAANIDTAILVMGLDRDFNLRRAERYLSVIRSGGVRPVILLNKADLCEDAGFHAGEVAGIAEGVPLHVVSAMREEGLEALKAYVQPRRTAVLLGSSGAGKSTLTNWLLGAAKLSVGEVRPSDGRGRHTTTRRELLLLPGGGMIVDSPGLRELQPWEGATGAFGEIEGIAARCRFPDCRHDAEPGCAVRRGITERVREEARFENLLKLQREEAGLAWRKRQRAFLAQRKDRLVWKRRKAGLADPDPS